jgi:hypothetical protein
VVLYDLEHNLRQALCNRFPHHCACVRADRAARKRIFRGPCREPLRVRMPDLVGSSVKSRTQRAALLLQQRRQLGPRLNELTLLPLVQATCIGR